MYIESGAYVCKRYLFKYLGVVQDSNTSKHLQKNTCQFSDAYKTASLCGCSQDFYACHDPLPHIILCYMLGASWGCNHSTSPAIIRTNSKRSGQKKNNAISAQLAFLELKHMRQETSKFNRTNCLKSRVHEGAYNDRQCKAKKIFG